MLLLLSGTLRGDLALTLKLRSIDGGTPAAAAAARHGSWEAEDRRPDDCFMNHDNTGHRGQQALCFESSGWAADLPPLTAVTS